MDDIETKCTAFQGTRKIASGTRAQVALSVKHAGETHETILIFESKDLDAVYKRTLEFGGATIVAPPTDWDVPTPDGKSKILLRTMSMFDPNGIYMEISQRR